jgi:hypothetical protein
MEPPTPNVPALHDSGTTPLTPVRRHGNGGTRRAVTTPSLGTVYTLCLTMLILASLVALGIADLPKSAQVLALVIGSGSAGILLGRNITVEVNGHGIHTERVERVATQQLPHERDQRD